MSVAEKKAGRKREGKAKRKAKTEEQARAAELPLPPIDEGKKTA
jgi:hypothetical protein